MEVYDELQEALKEIESQKKIINGMIENEEKYLLEINKLNKEIESWIKLINYNEIEDIPQYIGDLEVDNKSLKKENKELCQAIERLENIIKEVREYIEKNTKEGPIKDKRYFYSPEQANDILEILDKEKKND